MIIVTLSRGKKPRVLIPKKCLVVTDATVPARGIWTIAMTTLACETDLNVASASVGSGLGWAVLFCAGLMAWSFGGKLLKFLLVTSGIAVGAWVGSRMTPNGNPLVLLMGAGAGVLGSLAAHRLLVVSLAGSALAGLGLIGAFAWLSMTHQPLPEFQKAQSVIESAPLESEEAAAYRRAASEAFDALTSQNDPLAAKEILRSADPRPAARAAEHVGSGFESMWNELPESARRIISVTTVLCALAGGILAIADSKAAGAMVTAIGGSAAMLISGYQMAPHLGVSVPPAEAINPALAIAGWLVLSGLGVHRQRQNRAKQEGKAGAKQAGTKEPERFKGGTPCGSRCGS